MKFAKPTPRHLKQFIQAVNHYRHRLREHLGHFVNPKQHILLYYNVFKLLSKTVQILIIISPNNYPFQAYNIMAD